MRLHGLLSYATAPPASVSPLPRLEEGFRCACWPLDRASRSVAHVVALPDGPLAVGHTKRAVLSVPAGAAAALGPGALVFLGTAAQEAIGQLVVHAVEDEPAPPPRLPQPPQPPVPQTPLTADEQALFGYAQAWVRHADRLCTALRAAFDLEFTRIGRLERTTVMGWRGTVHGISYAFHGAGCFFATQGLKLEVDFDSQGDWHGFDPWRLQTYVEWNHPDAGLSPFRLEQGLPTLVRKGWLYQLDRPGDERFYYVTPLA